METKVEMEKKVVLGKEKGSPDVELRSEEAQEILSMPPQWMLRWGTTVIFLLVLTLLFFAWLIRYPDVISGEVRITTTIPPVQLMSYSSGKIVALPVNNNETISKGRIIAVLENPLRLDADTFVQHYISEVEEALKNQRTVLPIADTMLVLGELQTGFDRLGSLLKTHNRITLDTLFQKSIEILQKQTEHYRSLNKISRTQITLANQDLSNVHEKYEANKKLYQNAAISKFDFMLEESRYIATKQQVNDLHKINIQSSLSLADCERQINDLKLQRDEKLIQNEYGIHEEINNIKNLFEQWERKYVIKAPFDGVISYMDAWAIDKYVQQGNALFIISPDDEHYIAKALIPNVNFGKIQIGQKVSLRMDNYAYNELGELIGVVKAITSAPVDNKYRVDITLNQGLKSTHNIKFDYKPEMTGTANIITTDASLLDRIFYKFKKLVHR